MSEPQSNPPASPAPRSPAYALPAALAWAVVVAVAGGLGCGWLISQFGVLGTLGLWMLGVIAGSVSCRITLGPHRAAAWSLVVACALAAVLAEVAWLHWNTKQGEEGWLKAVGLLPVLIKEFTLSVIVATVMTACGAHSAWWLAARRPAA